MRYYSAPRRALRGVRQLLYPRRCPFCNAVLGSIRTCPDCAEEVDRLRRKPGIRLDASQHYLGGLSGAAAPFRYEGCVRRAILRAKYQAAPWTAVELGVVLAELAFGSEVRMRGAEPVPQRVEPDSTDAAPTLSIFMGISCTMAFTEPFTSCRTARPPASTGYLMEVV